VVWIRVLASLRHKLDEVVEVPADFVELSRHGEQDLAELLQALLHLSRLASRGVVVLAVEAAGPLGILLCAAGFPAGHNPTRGRAVPGIARSAVHALHVYQLRRRAHLD